MKRLKQVLKRVEPDTLEIIKKIKKDIDAFTEGIACQEELIKGLQNRRLEYIRIGTDADADILQLKNSKKVFSQKIEKLTFFLLLPLIPLMEQDELMTEYALQEEKIDGVHPDELTSALARFLSCTILVKMGKNPDYQWIHEIEDEDLKRYLLKITTVNFNTIAKDELVKTIVNVIGLEWK